MATNSDKIAELRTYMQPDGASHWVSQFWSRYHLQRAGIIKKWQEIDQYIYATDTTTTANSQLPWVHTTTLPKLCNIRDNLHANYFSSLFPNDKWLTWQAYSKDAAKKEVADTVTAYMENKTREGHMQTTMSRLLYDYIDRGNAFAMPSFETRYKTEASGERTADFVGPVAVRIDPLDIVFNPLAHSIHNTPFVVRSVKTLGELKKLADTDPDYAFWNAALLRRADVRDRTTGWQSEDFDKAVQYQADGFGNMLEYYQSDYVEILEFYGDYHDGATGELHTNRMLTIVDRSVLVRDEPMPTYGGRAPISHVGWRLRSNNLWAMSPLENLVGLQYRLDHIENMKATAMDLMIVSPKKIIGEVEEFEWGPNAEIHIDEGGDVQEMAQSLNVLFATDNETQLIEQRMELYAGAPREAMGVRSPGEKTAFEVQSLENASGRIFQEKINQFEVELLEPLLNDMLETAHRNMNHEDVIRIIDNDIGVVKFQEITKEDITADGILRPVGARHFAQQAQELQNLIGVFNSPLGQMVAPHTSAKAMTKFVEDVVNVRGYQIFSTNVAIAEQQETATLVNQVQEDMQVAQAGPTEDDIVTEAPTI